MNSCLNKVKDWFESARVAKYKVDKLARRYGVSARQLQRFILKTTGLSPRVYLTRLRQIRALYLLREGWSSKEVARELGYSHSQHFSRDFRNFHGFLPSEVQSAPAVRMSDSGTTKSNFGHPLDFSTPLNRAEIEPMEKRPTVRVSLEPGAKRDRTSKDRKP